MIDLGDDIGLAGSGATNKDYVMIDLYTWTATNGLKVSILLEELGLPYTVFPVNLQKGEQHDPDFLKISPNNKVPAIVDHDGPGGTDYVLFESGAILMYLAEKTGRFMPEDTAGRYMVIQWLLFHVGHVAPMLGVAHHYLRLAPVDVPYSMERAAKEARRIYTVMDRRLGETEYLAGSDYTIADVATYPWVARFEYQKVDLEKFPNVNRWFQTVGARPAVQRGMEVPGPWRAPPREKPQ